MSPAPMPDDIRPDEPIPVPRGWNAPEQGVAADAMAAAAVYFGMVLGVAGMLGPLRDFFIRSGTDPLLATLSESTAVALVMTYGSGWVVRVFGVAATLPARLIVGAGAMTLFCVFGVLALVLGGASLSEIGSQLATPSGVIALVTLALGAVLPLARGRQ